MVCGIDEVGRGCIFGFMLACSVILKKKFSSEAILYDSKKISQKKREDLESKIKNNSIDFAFGVVSSFEIDNIGIHEANLLAFKRSVYNLKNSTKNSITKILIDGRFITKFEGEDFIKLESIEPVIRGDTFIKEIQAASILAKVQRDRLIRNISNMQQYSFYDLKNNVGYKTRTHKSKIESHGPSVLHRKTFNLF